MAALCMCECKQEAGQEDPWCSSAEHKDRLSAAAVTYREKIKKTHLQ